MTVDELWHVATCVDCGDMVQPFRDPGERETWVDAHRRATGHTVNLSVEMRSVAQAAFLDRYVNVPICERCWFDVKGHPPIRTVRLANVEECHACHRPTIGGIFVRIRDGEPWPMPTDDRYDLGWEAGYDRCLKDHGLEVEDDPPDSHAVETIVVNEALL